MSVGIYIKKKLKRVTFFIRVYKCF